MYEKQKTKTIFAQPWHYFLFDDHRCFFFIFTIFWTQKIDWIRSLNMMFFLVLIIQISRTNEIMDRDCCVINSMVLHNKWMNFVVCVYVQKHTYNYKLASKYENYMWMMVGQFDRWRPAVSSVGGRRHYNQSIDRTRLCYFKSACFRNVNIWRVRENGVFIVQGQN
jgi:hypothetical protein